MWNDEPNEKYFELIQEHKDRIVIELAGHDHFPSLRVHQDDDGDLFHNLFIAPSITPWYENNPGVTSFEIDDDTLVPSKLRSTFLNLRPTIDQDDQTPFEQLEFRELDYEEAFGITDMTA